MEPFLGFHFIFIAGGFSASGSDDGMFCNRYTWFDKWVWRELLVLSVVVRVSFALCLFDSGSVSMQTLILFHDLWKGMLRFVGFSMN